MGQHAYATLCYGVIVGPDEENAKAFPWPNPSYDDPGYDDFCESYDEPLDLLIEEAGIVSPYAPDGDDSEAGKTAYWAKREELEAAIPIEIIGAGVEDYRTEIIALKGTVTVSPEYGTCAVEQPTSLFRELEVIEAERFCKQYGLHPFDDPRWILSASFG